MPPLVAFAVLVAVSSWFSAIEPRWEISRVPARGVFTYVAMAQTPFWRAAAGAYEAPYCWRILGPLIVHVLPFTLHTGFSVLAVAALAGTVVALVWFLSGLGLSEESSAAGGITFVLLGAGAAYNLQNREQIDPLSFFLLTLALGAVVHRRGGLVVAALVLLAATKETVVLGVIATTGWVIYTRDRTLARWVAAGSVLSVLVLETIRFGIRASAPYSLAQEAASLHALGAFSGYDLLINVVTATGGTWGLLLPLASLQLVHAPRVMRNPALGLLVVAATAQTLVSIDIHRVVVIGFPAIVAASAFEIDWLAARTSIAPTYLWLATFASELPWLVYAVSQQGIPLLGWASGVCLVLAFSLPMFALVLDRPNRPA